MRTGTADTAGSLPVLAGLVGLVVRWVCGTCGGGGIASDGSTCPDCDGHGHTLTGT